MHFLSPTHGLSIFLLCLYLTHTLIVCIFLFFLCISHKRTLSIFLSMTNTHSFFHSFCFLTPVKWVKMSETKKIDEFLGFRRYVRNRKLVGVGHFAKPIASTKYFDLFASRLRRRWKCSTKSALQQRRKRPLGVELFFFVADDEA